MSNRNELLKPMCCYYWQAVDALTFKIVDKLAENLKKSISAEGVLPIHGKVLGLLSASDLKTVIGKAVASYNREVREIDILVFQEVRACDIGYL